MNGRLRFNIFPDMLTVAQRVANDLLAYSLEDRGFIHTQFI